MNDFLNQVALEQGNQLFQRMQHLISDVTKLDLKVVFYPQIGYMLSLASPDIDEAAAKSMVHTGLEYAFSSRSDSDEGEQRYYFRNQRTRAMDKRCCCCFCCCCSYCLC